MKGYSKILITIFAVITSALLNASDKVSTSIKTMQKQGIQIQKTPPLSLFIPIDPMETDSILYNKSPKSAPARSVTIPTSTQAKSERAKSAEPETSIAMSNPIAIPRKGNVHAQFQKNGRAYIKAKVLEALKLPKEKQLNAFYDIAAARDYYKLPIN